MNSIIEAQEDLKYACLLSAERYFKRKDKLYLRDWVWYFNGQERILCHVGGLHIIKGVRLVPVLRTKAINPNTGGQVGVSDYASWKNIEGNIYEEVSDL